MEFKDKVLIARAQLDISQEQLAKELNVAYVTVNRWENGKIKPTKKAIIQFETFCRKRCIVFDGVNNDEKN